MFHNIKSYLFSIIVFMVSITSSFGVTITYNLNGGHLLGSNETTYQIDTDINPALSEKPILEDYAFVGWCSKSSRCSYEDFVTTIGISSLTDDTTLYAIYVPNISISCDDGQEAVFYVSRYWNTASAECNNCPSGSYCVAGTYSVLDLDPDSYYVYFYQHIGAQPCSGFREYSQWGQSSCSVCEVEDMAANPAHDGCVCWNDDNNDGVNDGDYIMEIDGSWDYNKSQCYRRDSIQCDIKTYAELLQYDSNTNRYEWFRCSGCKAGYYCPGGTYNYADKIRVWHPSHIEQYQAYLNGEQDYYGFNWGVGAYQCSGNQISDWYQSSCDISCPDNSSPNLLHAACVCNSGYIFNLSTNECVSRDVMVCPSTNTGSRDGREAQLESYNSETNQYDAFECVMCHGGYYCDGTVFEYDESKIHDNVYLGGKACTGDTYTGYNDNATSCKQCPNGLSATDNHMMCQCPDGTYWNVDDGNCGTSCPAGTYADFDYYSSAHGEPAYECRRCEPGYYCDGTNSFGGSNLTPEDNGLKSCGDGKYSAYNSTSISDCGVCEKNADAFTTGESDGNGGCVCEDGFRWDNDRAICIVSGCPSWENFPGFAPYGENGGMLMAIDHFGYTYTDLQGNVQNECVMPWLVFESPIASEEDMMNAIENGETYMMLCKHKRINNDNPYIGPCTKAGKVSSLNELMEMFENIDAFLPWIMDKMHESNPENIFTTTTDIDVEGTNEGAVVFATEGANCTTATVLGAQMCLIDGLPGENVNALVARKNGQIYHMLLSNTEHTITSNSSHVLKIIAASGTWYAHDESVE